VQETDPPLNDSKSAICSERLISMLLPAGLRRRLPQVRVFPEGWPLHIRPTMHRPNPELGQKSARGPSLRRIPSIRPLKQSVILKRRIGNVAAGEMRQETTRIDAYIGDQPEELPNTADSRVLRGQGHVAKLATAELVEREYRLLQLAPKQFPMRVPKLVDHGIFWIVMREVPQRRDEWSDQELLQAVRQLAQLHERFMGSSVLDEPWLRDPLDKHLDVLLAEARTLDSYLDNDLKEILADPSEIVEYLRKQPKTLLHGDPFPDNILRIPEGVDPDEVSEPPCDIARAPQEGLDPSADAAAASHGRSASSGAESAQGEGTLSNGEMLRDRLVWIDWCHASVGPPVADLASWLDQTPFAIGRPIDRLTHINAYLEAWESPPERDTFLKSLDAARVLWFFAYDLPQLAVIGRSNPDLVAKLNEEALRAYTAFSKA
jgi:thiamine kinase-like enzyme